MAYRILLINPWIYDFAAVNMWARPLGLLQVAEFLSAYNVELSLIDCMAQSEENQYHMGRYLKTTVSKPDCLTGIDRGYARYGLALDAFQARLRELLPIDAILISCVMTYWYPGVMEAIRQCRSQAPATPLCLGGIYPQLYPDHALNRSGADAVYLGAADSTLLQVLADFNLSLKPVRAPRPYYALDFYPGMHFAPLQTSVGCPFSCTYCASSVLHPAYARQSVNQVVRHIKDLHALGVKDIAFSDDALLFEPEQHILPILKEVIAAKLNLRFHTPNGLHARFVDQTTAQCMYKAGFKTIRLSLETVNTRRQNDTGGKIVNREFSQAVTNLRRAGFAKKDIGVYLMYGLPGQPVEEIMEGIRFLADHDVRIHLTEFSPLPGTPLWRDLIKNKIIPPDIDPLLTNNSVFSALYSGYTKADIKHFRDRVAQHNQKPD